MRLRRLQFMWIDYELNVKNIFGVLDLRLDSTLRFQDLEF